MEKTKHNGTLGRGSFLHNKHFSLAVPQEWLIPPRKRGIPHLVSINCCQIPEVTQVCSQGNIYISVLRVVSDWADWNATNETQNKGALQAGRWFL